MAEFTGDLQCFKSPLSFLEMDSNIELINQFAGLSSSVLENTNLSLQSLMGFSSDNFLASQQTELPVNFSDNLPAEQVFQSVASAGDVCPGSKKRKAMDVSESSSRNSSPPSSEAFSGGASKIKRKNNMGRGKKGSSTEKDAEKPKEVIHVRARRGQATDSHSLAERVRREKINERLRCLQNLVPGCYKTMGMAVMLDEIINYVQSLQNQVEFLSMKLTAASSFYDFNSETEAPETMQGTEPYVTQEMERLMRDGHGGLPCFHTTWPL